MKSSFWIGFQWSEEKLVVVDILVDRRGNFMHRTLTKGNETFGQGESCGEAPRFAAKSVQFEGKNKMDG